jgi:hypothetical protein
MEPSRVKGKLEEEDERPRRKLKPLHRDPGATKRQTQATRQEKKSGTSSRNVDAKAAKNKVKATYPPLNLTAFSPQTIHTRRGTSGPALGPAFISTRHRPRPELTGKWALHVDGNNATLLILQEQEEPSAPFPTHRITSHANPRSQHRTRNEEKRLTHTHETSPSHPTPPRREPVAQPAFCRSNKKLSPAKPSPKPRIYFPPLLSTPPFLIGRTFRNNSPYGHQCRAD